MTPMRVFDGGMARHGCTRCMPLSTWDHWCDTRLNSCEFPDYESLEKSL